MRGDGKRREETRRDERCRMHALLCIGVESYESFNILLFLPATLQGDNNCSTESVALFKGVFSSLFVDMIGITVPPSFSFSGTFGTGGFRDFAYTSNPLGEKKKKKRKRKKCQYYIALQ